MSYTEFETEDAIYYLNLENHNNPVDSVPKNVQFDASIRELLDKIIENRDLSSKEKVEAYFDLMRNQMGMKILELGEFKLPLIFKTGMIGINRNSDVYFLDAFPNIKESNEEIGRMVQNDEKREEVMRAMRVLLSLYFIGKSAMIAKRKKDSPNEKIKRRDFIKIGLAFLLAGGLYLNEPTRILEKLSEDGKLSKFEEVNNAISRMTDFEQFVASTLRDAITAEKTEIIAKELREKLGRKPRIGIYYGAAHIGIKELLLDPEERKKIFEGFNPLSRHFIDPKEINRVILFLFDKKTRKFTSATKRFNVSKTIAENENPKTKPIGSRITPNKEMSRREFLARLRGSKPITRITRRG